uniref:Uncharacterized protein n=2 Tax=Picea TaxID=3328 RepID=A0A101LXX0_PICGL|nr:hypothetical protein ABT39_MTgene5551 [Picea glauca]QHR91669.1 hypothetical protein Q903MT_gene5705 [Picea sitchensis]
MRRSVGYRLFNSMLDLHLFPGRKFLYRLLSGGRCNGRDQRWRCMLGVIYVLSGRENWS